MGEFEKPKDTEDKQAWCDYGAELEIAFVERLRQKGNGVAIGMNPDKKHDKYTFDLIGKFQCDLKTCETPFRTCYRYGFDPKYAITIDKKDIDRYTKLYPNIILVLDIRYPNYTAIKTVSIQTLARYVKEEKAKPHEYKKRVNDTKGNAKSCYIFDSRWFDDLILKEV